jgi:hypothetical protein
MASGVDSLLTFKSFFFPERGQGKPLSFLRSGSDEVTGHLLGRGRSKAKEFRAVVGLRDLNMAWRAWRSRVAQTLASQRVCGFPPATTRGSGL